MTIEDFLHRLANVRQSGAGWTARCPTHPDMRNSLSVHSGANGRILFTCFAGCEKVGVLTALGLTWSDVEPTGDRFASTCDRPQTRRPPFVAKDSHVQDASKRTESALRVWHEAEPACGTLAETYLRARGIVIPLPPTLRYHPGLKHPSNGLWPGLLAVVTRGTDNTPIGIHRTFLSHDGRDKAPVEPQKMMLGPCRGGAVRLGPLAEPLLVGEGIETCLAVMQATGRSPWAALSTSGLRGLDLPRQVRDVVVLADGDDAGETAAQDVGRRWRQEGRRVRIARPPRGCDFNDVLLGRTGLPSESSV